MATDIITRTGKAAALSAANNDQNLESFSGTVDAKTADYTVLYTDQNKIIEFSKSTAITCNLDAVATILAAIDTTKFRVTIKNIGLGNCIIDPNASELINFETTLTLAQDESAEIQINAAGNGWNVISSSGVMLTWTQVLSNKTLSLPVISQIVNTGTITLPVSTTTLVGRDTTDTLTNKTLSSSNTVSASLTWSAAQNLNNQALTNVNIDSGNIAAVTMSGSHTWSAAQNFSTGTTTIATADVNGGNIDGTTIGGSVRAAGNFTSVNLTTDLSVANGGTGTSSLQDHWVLVGSGTGAITAVSPSTSGYVLTSRGTSLDPTFQATVSPSDFVKLTAAITTVNGPGVGSVNTGFGTDDFIWGILAVRRTDSSSTNCTVTGTDDNDYKNTMVVGSGGASAPSEPASASNGQVNLAVYHQTGAGSGSIGYSVQVWAKRI